DQVDREPGVDPFAPQTVRRFEAHTEASAAIAQLEPASRADEKSGGEVGVGAGGGGEPRGPRDARGAAGGPSWARHAATRRRAPQRPRVVASVAPPSHASPWIAPPPRPGATPRRSSPRATRTAASRAGSIRWSHGSFASLDDHARPRGSATRARADAAPSAPE